MNKKIKLPMGIENFEKIRKDGFYYIDKTGLIRELLSNWGEVNLFTRPRRFGKSLNMNMLKYFFEYGCDASLFEGLEIAGERELCETYMGKFPVISISLKGVNGRTFESARALLRTTIGTEAMRFQFLLESSRLTELEKTLYRQLVTIDTENRQGYIMPQDVLSDSLRLLCGLLQKHYGEKVILLIDEYDVPLAKAQQSGYYDEMTDLIRNLFDHALKSNDSLKFAVLTGCLQISKESIFTGLNNPQVLSITNVQFDEHFGFSETEVRTLLEDYGLSRHFDTIKEWYDGYRFGKAEVYCPWDVINYCADLLADPDAPPSSFWANTSGNDIVREFIRMAKPQTRREIEQLVAGESIAKKINQKLTYRELYASTDNLWSVLFTTGYLTQRERLADGAYLLAIPNLEIRQIFVEQILEWYQEEVRRDPSALDAFCAAFSKADADAVETYFNAYLSKTISIRDTAARKTKKENFYHGILLGLLSHREDWILDSNAESGEGFSDILIEIESEQTGIVIEVKYPADGDLETGCAEAMAQIEEKGYETRLLQNGMDTIIKYGIACYKKRCKVTTAVRQCTGKC